MISEKRKAYLAEWREKNREKVREAQRRYYAEHKDLCNTRVMESRAKKRDFYNSKVNEWRVQNKDKYLETKRKSYANNSAVEIERVRRRKGRIRQGLTLMNKAEQAEVQGLYDFCKIFKNFEVDHIIPLNGKTVSGLHVLGNLQVIERSRNRSKGAKFVPSAFAQQEQA